MGGPLRGRHLSSLPHQALSGAQAALEGAGCAGRPRADRCGQDVIAPSLGVYSGKSSLGAGPTILPTVCPNYVTVGATIVPRVCPHYVTVGPTILPAVFPHHATVG